MQKESLKIKAANPTGKSSTGLAMLKIKQKNKAAVEAVSLKSNPSLKVMGINEYDYELDNGNYLFIIHI